MKSPVPEYQYAYLLTRPTAAQWRRIGVERRAGVAAPLFSVYSRQSVGLGEFPDLRLLADWCAQAGFSILLLLPLNDVGFNFFPYDAKSSFALEPMYLSIEQLAGVDRAWAARTAARLRGQFPTGGRLVNYAVKAAKLDALWEAFQQLRGAWPEACERFVDDQRYWIDDHALFTLVKELHGQAGWRSWPEALRDREAGALSRLKTEHGDRFRFHQWVQWQSAEQLRAVKAHAERAGVLVMGDLPFLVSGDSSDVWSHQEYFRLDTSSGAPPDAYFATGQRWGMPPYRWDRIEAGGYDYVIARLRCAEQYYDLFRVDHMVGVYRLWTIAADEPEEHGGLRGAFDPPDEAEWEEHGRRILSMMTQHTRMLPCGEDLGTVPDCNNPVLEEFGIPGMDVQRWKRDWKGDCGFLQPSQYRATGLSTVSTHDAEPLTAWWRHEAGTVDAQLCRRLLDALGLPVDDMRRRLFDGDRSTGDRWRWRRELRTVEDLLAALGRSREEAGQLVQEFRTSRHERTQFLQRLGLASAADGVDVADAAADRVDEHAVIQGALTELCRTSSVFCVSQLQDWLALDHSLRQTAGLLRLNRPGVMHEENWRLVMPFPLEALAGCVVTRDIRHVLEAGGRCL